METIKKLSNINPSTNISKSNFFIDDVPVQMLIGSFFIGYFLLAIGSSFGIWNNPFLMITCILSLLAVGFICGKYRVQNFLFQGVKIYYIIGCIIILLDCLASGSLDLNALNIWFGNPLSYLLGPIIAFFSMPVLLAIGCGMNYLKTHKLR